MDRTIEKHSRVATVADRVTMLSIVGIDERHKKTVSQFTEIATNWGGIAPVPCKGCNHRFAVAETAANPAGGETWPRRTAC